MKSNQRLIAAVVFGVALVGGGFWVFRGRGASDVAAEPESVEAPAWIKQRYSARIQYESTSAVSARSAAPDRGDLARDQNRRLDYFPELKAPLDKAAKASAAPLHAD
jgi:hypothetical protein